MTTLTIQPGRPLRGTLSVPGDKSITHRAIILSALADGLTTVSRYCQGQDCLNTMRAFRAMGIAIEESPNRLRIHGKGMWGLCEPDSPIDCGNSGTGIRLLAGLLAGQDFFAVLTGDESIRRRPMGRVVRPLRQMGATIGGRKGGELVPLAITGTRLHGLEYVSPIASAQVKSALLLAGLYAEGETRVTEPSRSRDHTERMFKYFGIPVRVKGTTITIDGRPSVGWRAKEELIVPGDMSAAAFFLVGASIVPGSEVVIESVGMNPTRTGVLEILGEMGADISALNCREEAGEPVADLRVRAADLRGIHIGAERIPQTIDEFPILCVAAAMAEGDTTISGAQELRVKESDRIATMAAELRKMGVGVTERQDGLVVQGRGAATRAACGQKALLQGATCQSYGDHRVAMSMAVAGLVADRPTIVEGCECIETSFPDFHSKLLKLLTDTSPVL